MYNTGVLQTIILGVIALVAAIAIVFIFARGGGKG
jgi:hypothetical protein